MQEVWSASAYCCSLITEPNCLIRSETTRKAQCYTAPGQRLFLNSGRCIFFYLGTGGRAQLCSSPVAWLLMASQAEQEDKVFAMCHVLGQPEGRKERAKQRRRLFASSQHLESLWFMWEIWEAGDRANVVTVSEQSLQKCSCFGNSVCVQAY